MITSRQGIESLVLIEAVAIRSPEFQGVVHGIIRTQRKMMKHVVDLLVYITRC